MANKSIYLIADSFVKAEFIKKISQGIEDLLEYWPSANWPKPVIKNFRDYLFLARQTEHDLEALLKEALDDPWREKINGYCALTNLPKALEKTDLPLFSVLVTSFAMYNGTNRDEICIGLTRPLIGAILSVSAWQDNGQKNSDSLKLLAKHLTGHALGLYTPALKKNPSLAHCQNNCVMQPYDHLENLEIQGGDRKEPGLCLDCQEILALILSA
jgi:hypothetical protein